MRMVAESFAAAVARVYANGVCAEKMNVSHVTHESLAREERTVADLTLEITRQYVRRFVLQQRRTVDRTELAVAAVIGTLAVRILRAVQADMLAQIPVEHTAVRTYALTYETQQISINK